MTALLLGSTGLVGSAFVRRGIGEPTPRIDLTRGDLAWSLIGRHMPDTVIMCAGLVGGIKANMARPSDFFSDNTRMTINVIDACVYFKVRTLLLFGSACMYPREAPLPHRPSHLFCGPPEPTNAPYAVAKIAALAHAQAAREQSGLRAIYVIPCNLYGPGDRSDHVIPDVMRKTHAALAAGSDLHLFGTGQAWRSFLYVDDLVDACELLLERYDTPDPINVGPASAVKIADTVDSIVAISGFGGRVVYDEGPDGAPHRLLNVEPITELGWRPRHTLQVGLTMTWEALCKSVP